ncbi:MAG TPA: hypothetical protein VGG04_15765 [Candidatus Sulfotelmatobacter sp.]|jgi:thymidylate kinase
MNFGAGQQRSGGRGGRRPCLITFSGVDGAGKTTQIEELSSQLQRQGLRVLRLSFWDDIAVWTNLRSEAGQHAARIHHKRNPDDPFVARNHKHIRRWYLTATRSALYVLDVFRLRRVLRSSRLRNADMIIFDRYIYDQIANIDSHRFAMRAYARLLLRLAPSPDLAFILDASPDAAFSRKREYPLEFVHRNRQSFLRLRELEPNLILLPAAGIDEIKREITEQIGRSRLATSAMGEITECSANGTVGWRQSSCRVQNEPTTRV